MRWMIAALLAMAPVPGVAAELPPLAGGQRFDPGDGTQIWYREAGRKSGVPVVFLHGGPGEGSMVLQGSAGPAMERRLRMVYLDQRGAGRSARPAGAQHYSLRRISADIEALRVRLGVPRIVLLAHSAGSVMALDYAVRHPERLAGLVLTGAIPDVPATMDAMCDKLQGQDAAAFARAVAARTGAQKCDPFAAYEGGKAMQAWFDRAMFPDPAVAERVRRLDEADGLKNTGAMGSIFGEIFPFRFRAYDRLTMPVLVIDGERDDQTDAVSQRALARAVRDGRFVQYRGVGHFTFVEAPERFARDVARFVARLR